MFVEEMATSDSRKLSSFIDLARRLYPEDSRWVQPLTREVKRKLNPSRSAFYRYGSVKLFGLFGDRGDLLGRIAAILNPWHERLHKESAGFFGMFECIESSEGAGMLLCQVENVLRNNGCSCMIGPVNLTTNDESGFLLKGHEHPPTFMCNYCYPYYHNLVKSFGMQKLVDTIAYETRHGHVFPQKYYSVIERVSENPRLRLFRFSRRQASEQIAQIREIYNESFASTYGFVPISEGEAEELADGLLSFADLELVWIASYDSLPVGFILGFPDLNEVLIHSNGRLGPIGILRLLMANRTIKGMRVAALGVIPQFQARGIEALLIRKVHQRINDRPYQRIEFSVVMENNTRMRRLLETFGFSMTKTYRIYRKELWRNL